MTNAPGHTEVYSLQILALLLRKQMNRPHLPAEKEKKGLMQKLLTGEVRVKNLSYES